MEKTLSNLKLLGKTPLRLKELDTLEDVLDYFLYFYEITWSNVTFPNMDSYKDFMLERVKEEKNKNNIEELTLEEYWWFLILILLKFSSEQYELDYMTTSIDLIFEQFNTYSLTELEDITNMFNSALSSQVGELLATRPSEIIRENLPIFDGDFILEDLLKKKDKIIKLISKNLRQKDFNKDVIGEILIIDRKITRKFSSNWENIYDLFVIYIISMSYEIFYQDLSTGTLDIDKLNIKKIKSLVFSFFEVFLLDRDLGVKPTEDLASFIMELIENKYKRKDS